MSASFAVYAGMEVLFELTLSPIQLFLRSAFVAQATRLREAPYGASDHKNVAFAAMEAWRFPQAGRLRHQSIAL